MCSAVHSARPQPLDSVSARVLLLPGHVNALVLALVLSQAPQSNGARIGAGVSLLAAGTVASIANTTAAYITCEAYLSCFSWAAVSPFGIAASTVPLVGPAAGIIADLAFWSEARANFPERPGRDIAFRTVVNAVSLAMQVTGLVLLLTTPRAPKASKAQGLAVTDFGVAPVNGGAVLGLGGTFDFH